MAEQCSGCRRAIPPGGRGFLFGDKGRALCLSCGVIYCLDCFDTLTKSPMRWHRPPEWFSLFFSSATVIAGSAAAVWATRCSFWAAEASQEVPARMPSRQPASGGSGRLASHLDPWSERDRTVGYAADAQPRRLFLRRCRGFGAPAIHQAARERPRTGGDRGRGNSALKTPMRGSPPPPRSSGSIRIHAPRALGERFASLRCHEDGVLDSCSRNVG